MEALQSTVVDLGERRERTKSVTGSGTVGEERFAELRARLVQAVGRVCPAWLANDRDDIVQNAMTRLMLSAQAEGTDLEYSATYLRKVAYTHVVDEIRRRRRRKESALETVEEAGSVLASTQPDPEDMSAGTELGQAIRGCLEGLVPPRRQAVSLWLLGYGHKEIAERLGWKRKRAENLVTRGRENLRDCLTRKGYRS
jgi:RNA polymerase sigma-70 factor (ECF subfamily)